MKQTDTSHERGREDAGTFIRNERIDYKPFVAISDMHLVRKTVPISYASLEQTVGTLEPELWKDLDAAAAAAARAHGSEFSYDEYAEGFAAGVAAVWETIRDEVLK